MQERDIPGENDIREFRSLEEQFPTDPQERLAALLASYNIGPKSVTHLLLPAYGYISTEDLRKKFRKVFAGTDIQQFRPHIVDQYCEDTLCPIGLVAKRYSIDVFGVEKVIGYGLTEAGNKYGTPAAALSLYFETSHNVSLYPILGSTSSPSADKRAPYARARVLQALQEEGQPLRQADLCIKLDLEHATVKDSLEGLAKAGAIIYKSVTPHTGKTRISYRMGNLPADQVTLYRDQPFNTKTAIEICAQLANEGVEITLEEVAKRYSKIRGTSDVTRGQRARLSGTLTHLERQGYIKSEGFKGNKVLSSAELTELGEEVVNNYLNYLVGLVSDDLNIRQTIQRDIVPEITGNFGIIVRKSADLYYEHSKSRQIRELQERRQGVLNVIGESPDALSLNDLSRATGIHRMTVFHLINPYIKSGQLRSETIKGVNYYKFKAER